LCSNMLIPPGLDHERDRNGNIYIISARDRSSSANEVASSLRERADDRRSWVHPVCHDTNEQQDRNDDRRD
jgi:hypothetical protein